MDEHGAEHGADHGHGHGAHGPEIWETSIWPVIAALGAISSGLCLVWVAKDSGNDFAGPLAGASLAATILAVVLWIWERRKKAEEQAQGHDIDVPNPRFTQVLTFTVAPGQLDRARQNGGVIHEIEATDVTALEGFQDFRITVAPTDGPSQVLVETTWLDREGLAGYNASRSNALDIIARHDEEVLAGSVQAFDMEVVRDTKQYSYRFGTSTALAILGGLMAGGFMFGAAQTLFQEDVVVADGGGPVGNPYEIEASDNRFDKDLLVAPPNVEVTFTMVHSGVNPHNLSFYMAPPPGGEVILAGEIISSGSVDETFTTPDVGVYYFQCDVHPDQMNGTFEVSPTAPPPGGAPPAPEGEGGEGEEGEGESG